MNIVLAALRKKIAGIEIPTTRKELDEKGYVFINGEPTDENLTIIEKNDYCNRNMQEKDLFNPFVAENPEANSKIDGFAQDYLNRKGLKFDFISALEYKPSDNNSQYTLQYKIKPVDDTNDDGEYTLYVYPDAPYVKIKDSNNNEFEADILDKLQMPSGDKEAKVIYTVGGISSTYKTKKDILKTKIKGLANLASIITQKIKGKNKGSLDGQKEATDIMNKVQEKAKSFLPYVTTGSAEYIQNKLEANYIPLLTDISNQTRKDCIDMVLEHANELESLINFDVKTGN